MIPTLSEPPPDVRDRPDIGAFIGHATPWAGGICGDVGEIIVYNKALGEGDRRSIESYLAHKFGVTLPREDIARARNSPLPKPITGLISR